MIREIPESMTGCAAEALLVLRPRWGTSTDLVEVIDTRLRPIGYRLIGVFLPERDSAVAVAGFRELTALGLGHCLYVDDVSTLPSYRGQGYGDRLMSWLADEARRLGCEGLH